MLIVKGIQLKDFYNRWTEKSKSYSNDDLADLFDKFFSLYVVYNRIYNITASVLYEEGEIEKLKKAKKIKRNKRETEVNESDAAIFCIAHYLRDNLEEIISENINEINDFKFILENKLFNIDLFYGQPQPKKDKKLLKGLESKNNLIVIESLLTILYKVRCNIFHAEKGFNEEQRIILEPVNNLLEKLIKTLISKVTRN